jgi:hypothetical protein
MKDKDKKLQDENKKQIPSKKGRYAEKLNLKMDFKEAVSKAVNTKVKFDKKI